MIVLFANRISVALKAVFNGVAGRHPICQGASFNRHIGKVRISRDDVGEVG